MLALSVSTMPVGLIYHLGHTTNVNISLYLHRLSLMSSPALIWIDPLRFNFIFLRRITFHLCIQEQLSFYNVVFLFLVDSNLATVPSKKAQVVSDSGMHWISVCDQVSVRGDIYDVLYARVAARITWRRNLMLSQERSEPQVSRLKALWVTCRREDKGLLVSPLSQPFNFTNDESDSCMF